MITKNTCGGHPRIQGTRLEVFNIINCLWDGMSIEEISKFYNLSVDEVKDSIKWVGDFFLEHFDSKID